MANDHRQNVLVTSCLKTPVDPHTKAPLASYERDCDRKLEYEDYGSDFCDEDCQRKADTDRGSDCLNLSEIFFSNEEYYSKLEELKRAHLRTMAELESLYHHNLHLRTIKPSDTALLDAGSRLPWHLEASCHPLRKTRSAFELRRSSGQSESSEENETGPNEVEKAQMSSLGGYIKNMWKDFNVSSYTHHQSSSSLCSMSANQKSPQKTRSQKTHRNKDGQQENWKHKVTVPKPFQMTVREAEKHKLGKKTRSEMEQENTELRRQLEDLTECQRKFRASPVPAHIHLPLYGELQERNKQRRITQEQEEKPLRIPQKPFSFLERERLKKEQKQLRQSELSEQKFKPFKAKPVPKCVYAAASGERMKEEQLYRSIRIQMRAQEMLSRASIPSSMLTERLCERSKRKDRGKATSAEERFSHKPQINRDMPDFEASHKHFQKQLENRREVKPTTAVEPFKLRTSQISSHKERILADIEKDRSSPRMMRWPHMNPRAARTPNSSLCSSLSGSLDLLPAKDTDATKKRHEAVRKALEQRKKAEEEEERRKEKQRQREKELQRMVVKRAQANDPHRALSQTNHSKLKEFRKQEIQHLKEYQQEMREMRDRVKGRPLLLEQVAQKNVQQAVQRCYIKALHGWDLTEDFIRSTAAESPLDDRKLSDQEETDSETVHYKKVFVDDEDTDDPEEGEGNRDEEEEEDANSVNSEKEHGGPAADPQDSEDSYHYSEDHENDSDESERDAEETHGSARNSQ